MFVLKKYLCNFKVFLTFCRSCGICRLMHMILPVAMESVSTELSQTLQDSIQQSDASGNFAQSFQALFASSDPASQLQLLQAVGALPHSSTAQMVFVPGNTGDGGTWPQQYVMLPRLNQFVVANSEAGGSSSAQAVILAALNGAAMQSAASPHRSLSSPAHMLNGVNVSQSQPNTGTVMATQSQVTARPDVPKPPAKPLSAYMSFSKLIWPQVKQSHPNASVCEIGAIIGQLWNELDEAEKKRYNDNYAANKVRYNQELQSYLQATGLKASDLVKPRVRKGRTPAKPSINNTPQKASGGQPDDAAGVAASALGALPHFSQVWANNTLQLPSSSGQTVIASGVTDLNLVGPITPLYSHSGNEVKLQPTTSNENGNAWLNGTDTQPTRADAETELQTLRDAVSSVTREAEQLKRQLDEAVAYIRQLEEQQNSVLSDPSLNGGFAVPTVGTI